MTTISIQQLCLNNNGFNKRTPLVVHTLSFLDVKTLLQQEIINKNWRKLYKKTIWNKCYGHHDSPNAFQSKQELKNVITKYCEYKAPTMEEIACTYGYPIDSLDVSQLEDMSELFRSMDSFNEYIGSWDVSNATYMNHMFDGAKRFNQDIGSWDTSGVADMSYMFSIAENFNQDIGSWDVFNVTDMRRMFMFAEVFDVNIGCWDVSKVTNMTGMLFRYRKVQPGHWILGCFQRNRHELHV
jgi:surface protein